MNIWLDGHILPLEKARISPLDRGFLFGDGVYEVVRFFDRVGMAMDAHISRLGRSLQLTGIKGFDAGELPSLCDQLLRSERLRDACVYVQVTRGVAPARSHLPPDDIRPTVFALAYASGALDTLTTAAPIALSIQPDIRWHRCEIKSTSLMGSILPMLDGRGHDAQEAILVRDGFVSEGSSSNIFVAHGNSIATPPIDTDPSILHGTMRALAMEAVHQLGLSMEIRPIRESELANADEIWITGSGRVLASCVALNGRMFGTGKPGKWACHVINRMRVGVENCLMRSP